MFERYTEKARRVIFFARYEASQFGNHEIGDAHLLLGLVRECKDVVRRVLARPGEDVQHVEEEIRRKVEEALGPPRPGVSTSVDMPVSVSCKRILAYAAEEADRMKHRHIGTEHLLLGMLREQGCIAASVLQSIGMELTRARERLAATAAAAGEVPRGLGSGSGGGFIGSRTPGHRAGIIEFICEGRIIASVVMYAVSPLPRVGERVTVKNKEGVEEAYRVEGLQYVYEPYPPDMAVAPHQLAKVVMQLRRE